MPLGHLLFSRTLWLVSESISEFSNWDIVLYCTALPPSQGINSNSFPKGNHIMGMRLLIFKPANLILSGSSPYSERMEAG